MQWVVQQELEDRTEPWCFCVGCHDPLDHKQHNVATLSREDIAQVIPKHWEAKVVISL